MKAFLAFPKKAERNFMQQSVSYPTIPEDDRPTLVIAKDVIIVAKEFPDAIKITECNVKTIVIFNKYNGHNVTFTYHTNNEGHYRIDHIIKDHDALSCGGNCGDCCETKAASCNCGCSP